MPQKRSEPTWPLLCILVCLFVLSATSPSLWERAAKKRSMQAFGGRPQAGAIPQETTVRDASLTADLRPNRDELLPQEAHAAPIKTTSSDERCPAVGVASAAAPPVTLVPSASALSQKPEAKPSPVSNVPVRESSRRPEDVAALRALLLPTEPLGDGVERRRAADKKMDGK
jgi:hypothetical protein